MAVGAVACVWLVVGVDHEQWLRLEPQPRVVHAQVDPDLTADGALQLGSNQPPRESKLDHVQVESDLSSGRTLHVAIRERSGGYDVLTDELWFDFTEQGLPRVRAKSSIYDESSPWHHHVYGIDGRVRLSSAQPVRAKGQSDAPFIFAYEFTGRLGGSDARWGGKVALDIGSKR